MDTAYCTVFCYAVWTLFTITAVYCAFIGHSEKNSQNIILIEENKCLFF